MVRLLCVALAIACVGVSLGATSYPPVTFNDLVAQADVIFVGEVVDARPFAVETRQGTVIKTRVIFRVSDPVFGTTGAVEVFDFLGGELGGLGMKVAEMPQFAIGDRRVVFAHRAPSINPIVGFTQGLLQVTRDSSGVDRVRTLDGAPLAAPESIGRPQATVLTAVPMQLSGFVARIEQGLTEAGRR